MALSSELMDILACPKCKKLVEATSDDGSIRCHQCKLSYPVRDNIPVMLIDEAESF